MITGEGFMDIIAMHRSGLSVRAISRKLGLHRKTVKKHIEENTFPQYHKRKRGVSILDPVSVKGFLDIFCS